MRYSVKILWRGISVARGIEEAADNPTAYQVPYNASTLVQQQSMYRDIKTMNIEPGDSGVELMSMPLPKRGRRKD